MRDPRRVGRTITSSFWISLLIVLAAPGAGAAQAPTEPVSDEALTAFAELYLEVGEAREVFQTSMGATHDAVGQARLRAEFTAAFTEILERHETTREKFDALTALVSLDHEHRRRFEEILETLKEGGG